MRRTARWLRRLADRMDPRGAPRFTHWSFTFEQGEGIRFREDGRGCPVAYLGEDDYGRAHAEAGPLPLSVRLLQAGFAEYGRRMAEINSRAESPPRRSGIR